MTDTPAPDITLHPTTGEKIVLKSLLDFKEKTHIDPMTEDQGHLFLNLLSAEQEDKDGGKLTAFDRINLENNRHAEILKKISGGFGFRVFAGRMHPSTQLTVEAFLYLLDLCKGPGDAVLWSYTLFRLHQRDQQLITLSTLANEWPWGFPNEEGRHLCWRAQKGESYEMKGVDNLIDREVFWA